MSDAIKKLHDYLVKSPSVVYPEDVLAYLPAIEDENAKLRELCEQCAIELYVNGNVTDASTEMLFDDMRELGIEVGRVSWKAHEAAERIADGWYSELEYTRKRNAVLGRENAKLREQIHWLKQGDILHVLTDQEYIDQCERERLMQVSIDALDNENAKLQELVGELMPTARIAAQHGINVGKLADQERRARKLGVEVGE